MIRILYYASLDYVHRFSSFVKQINRKSTEKIVNIESPNPVSLMSNLREDPTYDMVLIHLQSSEIEEMKVSISSERGLVGVVETCRNIYDGLIVAESRDYPASKREILETFDDYIYPVESEIYLQRFVEFLKRYCLIPQDFEL